MRAFARMSFLKRGNMEVLLSMVYWGFNIIGVLLAISGIISIVTELFFVHDNKCFRDIAHAIIMSLSSVAILGFCQLIGSMFDAGSFAVGALAIIAALIGLVFALDIDYHDHTATRHYRRPQRKMARTHLHAGHW